MGLHGPSREPLTCRRVTHLVAEPGGILKDLARYFFMLYSAYQVVLSLLDLSLQYS
jgi:hypothetical protein